MKVLDIAPDRSRRREFARWIEGEGHEIVTVPGRREAIKEWKRSRGRYDMAVLDAQSDLYDTKALVQELRSASGKNDPIIAVVVEPKNRPPRHRLAGRASNVFFVQDGSVEHMAKILELAVNMREAGPEDDESAVD